MITHENIEIIHYFLQVDKALFKVMLAQLLAEYKAIHTPVRIVIFDAPADNEEYVARFASLAPIFVTELGRVTEVSLVFWNM